MKLLEKFLKSEIGVKPKEYINKFEQYEEKLFEWNQKVNLVSRKLESIENQIFNSIFFLTKYGLLGTEKVFDLGTGGGFPGIPLKILYPDIILVLNDSVKKKVNAIEDIVNSMDFKYVECVSDRAELVSKQSKFNKKFDVVISKSVSTITDLYTWSKSLMNENGHLICIKGGSMDKEISEFKTKFKKVSVDLIEFEFDPIYMIFSYVLTK